MSMEKVTRAIGYQVCCTQCGAASALHESREDAALQAEAAGWSVGSYYLDDTDYCPRCVSERERRLWAAALALHPELAELEATQS